MMGLKLCQYSGFTWFILIGMITTGAARSIIVKLAYQSGFQAPLTVTLLYLLGQSLSLVVYGISKWFTRNCNEALLSRQRKELELGGYYAGSANAEEGTSPLPVNQINLPNPSAQPISSSPPLSPSSPPLSPSSQTSSTSLSSAMFEFYASARATFYEDELISYGSFHGLSRASEERIKWVHNVPYYAKPAIPALLNLLNSALRWASLVYIDASVAEMLISGLELTLSVVAARIFRKRMVAKSRWVGVIIVAVGVIIIEHANNSKHQRLDNEEEESDEYNDSKMNGGTNDVMIGVILIVLQSILSVLQDIGEEIFMQASDFPATMMLGLEGFYGFTVGLIAYMTIGDRFGIEDIDSTMAVLNENKTLCWWLIGLPFLFLVTGLFNIKATEVTSAMTRNVWKNMRTVLVWATALCIFYLGHNSDYGEEWHIPESFVILLGFMVMCVGIIVYYWFKETEKSPETNVEEDNIESPQPPQLT